MRVFKRLALSLLVLVVVTAIALAVWEPLVVESGKAPASRK